MFLKDLPTSIGPAPVMRGSGWAGQLAEAQADRLGWGGAGNSGWGIVLPLEAAKMSLAAVGVVRVPELTPSSPHSCTLACPLRRLPKLRNNLGDQTAKWQGLCSAPAPCAPRYGPGSGKRWNTHAQDTDIKGQDKDRLRCRQTYLVPRHSITSS